MSDIALSKGVAAGGDGQPFVISGREITAVESGNSGLKIRVRGRGGADRYKSGQYKRGAGEKIPLTPAGTGALMCAARGDYLLTIFQVPSAWRQAVP
jgi:hypothetical protein